MNIVGHKATQKSLCELFESGRMPHALLFHGPQGIGKRLVAEVFARRLLCGAEPQANTEELSFNEEHLVFPQIEANSCPDFHILEPLEGKKSISVDQVRSMLKKLALSSDGERVVIIDAAEQMGTSAANALLKTLEEPGQGVHLVLVCHNLSKLLPTIVSRCRQFRFSPLEQSQVQDILADLYEDKNASEIGELTKLCNGCPGDAERLTGDGQIVLEGLENFFKKMPTASTLPALELADKLQRKKLAPMGVELLLRKLALFAREKNKGGIEGKKWAETYIKIQEKNLDMQELNLTPQLVLEAALADVQKTLNS